MKLQKELFRLMLEQLPEDKRSVAESLINNLIFMQETLSELQKTVKADGAIVELTGGNGFTTRQEHPALKSYNATMKTFNSTCKSLAAFFDDVDKNGVDDELVGFLKGNKLVSR